VGRFTLIRAARRIPRKMSAANYQNKAERKYTVLNYPRTPRPGLGCTPQIELSEACSCPKTPDAPKSKVTAPIRPPLSRSRTWYLRFEPYPASLSRWPRPIDPAAGRRLTLSGLSPKEESCNGNCYEQQRGERKNGVISECGAQGLCLILHPFRGGLFKNGQNFLWIHLEEGQPS
jgi:hypothetical protein